MIHDEIQTSMLTFVEKFNTTPNTERLMGLTEADKELTIVLCNTFTPAILSNPATFYFESVDMSEELLVTALEFYQEGLLILPFPACHFVTKRVSINFEKVKSKGDDEILGTLIQDPDTKEICVVTYGRAPDKKDWLPIVFTFVNKQSLSLHDTVHKQIHCFGSSKLSDEDKTEFFGVAKNQAIIFLTAALLRGMPHTRKEKIEIPDKLQKARARNRKPYLNPFIRVSLREDIQQSMDGQSHARGYKVKPHWRRGHIRTMNDGRKIAVQPCLVNWDGEAEIQKKAYKVVA